eukprot:5018284-Pyramimonas_sp.AAC.1
MPLLDVTFADGDTIVVIVPASGLYFAMCRALTVVVDAFASRGRRLILGVAKAAALLAHRGKGATKAKQHAWHDSGGPALARTHQLGTARARVVKHYVHLGSVIDPR